MAINPVDWAIAKLPSIGPRVTPWLKTPDVLGEGLGAIETGLAAQRKGVSAKSVVVSLPA